jgi:hypothetical protein
MCRVERVHRAPRFDAEREIVELATLEKRAFVRASRRRAAGEDGGGNGVAALNSVVEMAPAVVAVASRGLLLAEQAYVNAAPTPAARIQWEERPRASRTQSEYLFFM